MQGNPRKFSHWKLSHCVLLGELVVARERRYGIRMEVVVSSFVG